MRHDRSTEQIKRKLVTPQPRDPVTSHAGVASVGASGTKPTQPKTDAGNVAVNAKFNQSTKGPRERGNVVMVSGR